MLTCIMMTTVGFLSGAVMYSYWIPKVIYNIDVRDGSEDGNPGCANTIAAAGVSIGAICLVLDVLKAFIPVYISAEHLNVANYYLIPVAIAPVCGHAFSPFLGFKGGKAVTVSFGSLLGVIHISNAVCILALLAILFKFIIIIHPDSTKMIITYVVFNFILVLKEPLIEIKIAGLLIGLVACYKHYIYPNKGMFHINIGRYIIHYDEKRFQLSKAKS